MDLRAAWKALRGQRDPLPAVYWDARASALVVRTDEGWHSIARSAHAEAERTGVLPPGNVSGDENAKASPHAVGPGGVGDRQPVGWESDVEPLS